MAGRCYRVFFFTSTRKTKKCQSRRGNLGIPRSPAQVSGELHTKGGARMKKERAFKAHFTVPRHATRFLNSHLTQFPPKKFPSARPACHKGLARKFFLVKWWQHSSNIIGQAGIISATSSLLNKTRRRFQGTFRGRASDLGTNSGFVQLHIPKLWNAVLTFDAWVPLGSCMPRLFDLKF